MITEGIFYLQDNTSQAMLSTIGQSEERVCLCVYADDCGEVTHHILLKALLCFYLNNNIIGL